MTLEATIAKLTTRFIMLTSRRRRLCYHHFNAGIEIL